MAQVSTHALRSRHPTLEPRRPFSIWKPTVSTPILAVGHDDVDSAEELGYLIALAGAIIHSVTPERDTVLSARSNTTPSTITFDGKM